MRTTIELKDEHRARLLELAARRGEKGFSGLVNEAVEAYLKELETHGVARRRALDARGSLGRQDADELEKRVRDLRGSWR